MIMLPYSSRISKYALVVFFLVIAGYAFFEAQGVVFGPKIFVSSTVMEVSNPFIHINGTATHIDELTMNGMPISVTENGEFNEPYLLAHGNNKIVLEAKDKYGHRARQVIEIVYTGPPGGASGAGFMRATSTIKNVPSPADSASSGSRQTATTSPTYPQEAPTP